MQFDPRLTNLGITVTENANGKWALSVAQYQDENESQGNHNVYFTVLDDKGKPRVGVTCYVDWIGRDPTDPPSTVTTNAQGQGDVPLYANLDITKKNGPYFAFVESQNASDVVRGMGLPEKHHVNFLLTFAPRATSSPAQTLEEAVLAKARSVPWMAVNNTAALWQYAKAHGLQDQQTDELSFTYNGEDYICQVFNLGIVYCKKGEYGNIKVIPK